MLSLRISSYGCTWEVWRARKMRKSSSRRSREQLYLFECSPNLSSLSSLSSVLPTSRVFTSGYVNTETILHFFYKITNERGTKIGFAYAHVKWFLWPIRARVLFELFYNSYSIIARVKLRIKYEFFFFDGQLLCICRFAI